MRRHFGRGGWAVVSFGAVVAAFACGPQDVSSVAQTASSAGAGGVGGSGGSAQTGGGGASAAAGSSGSAGAKPEGTMALFYVPTDPTTLGPGPSRDGLVSADSGNPYPDFFDHPWPSDLRRDPDGKVRTKGFPNPLALSDIDLYVSAADRLVDGFSPQAAGFLRFTGPLDPSTLPMDPKASIDPSSSVQLVDVDDASPEKGTRKLISLQWREQEGVYWLPNTLAFQPTFGYPLRPKTRHALVVTNAAKAKDGTAIRVAPEIAAVLGNGPDPSGEATAALRTAWAPAIADVKAAGVDPASIVGLTVFTTADPTAELFAIRDDVRAHFPAPTTHDDAWVAKDQTADYDVYEGMYGPSPDYQEGTVPFKTPKDGGSFAFDANGNPMVQRMFDLRFALTVPKATACPMPANGYPVVLYAHGTGGDYRSYLDDGTGRALAKQCVASMGIDQIFHGTRPGAPPPGPDQITEIELLFFNFENPYAIRTNGRQAAVDEVQRARLFTESATKVPASVSRTGQDILFDGTKVLFFGHSQGGLNGPLYLAADDSARGGVLSGSGSIISISLLEKTKPSPSVAAAVKAVFLGLKVSEYPEVTPLHPAISLAQFIVDVMDPIHYVGHIAREPRTGFAPKSIYQTEGVNPDFTGDSYTPPHSIEVQAVATGLPLMNPVIHPVTEMQWGGPPPVTIPMDGLSGNLANGLASGVLAQWPASQASDGHFVVFDIPAARLQAATFCKNLADDPHGRVPAP